MLPRLDALLRRDFPSFIARTLRQTDPGTSYLPNWHIELIAEYLEAARRAEIRRLIINMPPRSLKSVCVSVAWPAWLLGHDPQSRIIAASYASSLSIKHSLDTRLVVTSPWFRRVFPAFKLTRDQNEKHKFMTTKRGFRLATSVGGSVTGEGGNYLILDDPINPMQAMNNHWREHANRWFDHTFASRLDSKENGVIVLVMQRLHERDMTHYLLEKGGWEHLALPAVATTVAQYDFGRVHKHRANGEVLHRGREGLALIERAKRELGSAAFAAQYQQQPIPVSGGMVRPWWFGRYITPPVLAQRLVQSWDTAIKSGDENDASVCLTFAEYEGKCYLLEASVRRCEYPDLKKLFYAQAQRWQPQAVLIEDKASGQQLLQDVRRESNLPVIALHPRHDKVTRFAAISAMIEAGKVVLPLEAPWLAEFEQELYTFPQGAHDDQVDALTQYLDWLRASIWDRLRVRQI